MSNGCENIRDISNEKNIPKHMLFELCGADYKLFFRTFVPIIVVFSIVVPPVLLAWRHFGVVGDDRELKLKARKFLKKTYNRQKQTNK